MKKLSLLDFRDYINNMSIDTFIFSTSNQQWQSVDDAMSVELVFKKMSIAFNPNTIFFTGAPSTLRLDRVKSITIRETPCALGIVFTVICGDAESRTKDRGYTIIAR